MRSSCRPSRSSATSRRTTARTRRVRQRSGMTRGTPRSTSRSDGRRHPPRSISFAEGATSDSDLAFFRGRRAMGQRWLGVDYYVTCEQVIYGDGEAGAGAAAHRASCAGAGLPSSLRDPALRVGDQPRRHARRGMAPDEPVARDTVLDRAGVPVNGFTWYPLTDVVDWRHALRIERNDVDPIGLCDLGRAVRPVGRAYAALIADSEPYTSQTETANSGLRSIPDSIGQRRTRGLHSMCAEHGVSQPGDNVLGQKWPNVQVPPSAHHRGNAASSAPSQ